MKNKLFPLTVMPAVPDEDDIKLLPAGSQSWIIRSHTDIVWALMSECRGYDVADVVLKTVRKQFPKEEPQTIQAVLDHLLRLGVIIDRPRAFKALFPLINNPPEFPQLMSFKEMRKYTKSSRLPIKQGNTSHLKLPNETDHLGDLQAFRRSCRNFDQNKSLSPEVIGRILVHTYSLSLHATPSGGGLYPLKLFIILTRDQATLAKGYYEYDPEKHNLVRYGELDPEMMAYALGSDSMLYNAPAIVVIAPDLDRQAKKYGNRAYLLSVLEAGATAQNIHLAAAQEQVATLQYGGFSEKVLAAELGMNETDASSMVTPVSVVALGYPATSKPTISSEDQLEKLANELIGKGKPIRRLTPISNDQSRGTVAIFGVHAYARHADDPRSNFIASGSATSSALARIKAIAEAYERYASGLVRVDRVASAIELTKAKEAWLDPRIVAPWTDKQYMQFSDKYEQFDEKKPLQWVEGFRPGTSIPVWVPVDLTFYPLHPEQWNRKRYAAATSSGVAAYTNEPEAIKRATFELLERHALMYTWFKQQPLMRISNNKLPYHYRRRIEYWASQGRQVYILDMSSQSYGMVGVSVVITGNSFPYFMSGAAVSDAFEPALAKAFHETELMVMCLREPDKPWHLEPKQVKSITDHALLYAQPEYAQSLRWLWSGKEVNSIPTQSVKMPALFDNLDAIAVRLSPDKAPLSVVRVLSDKLIPISFGYGNNYYTHQALHDTINVIAELPHYFA